MPITRSGATNGTFGSRAARANSASIEISIPGASTPPAYSPAAETTSKFVEVPKSTTIARRAVALARGDRVRDPVGPDLARVVVADRHARRDAGPEHEQLDARPALGERLVLAHELRHRSSESDDPVERREVDERAQHHRELVGRVRGIGADAELLGEALAVEQTEDGLRVADVDREQHRAALREVVVFVQAVAHPLGELLGGELGSSPSPFSSSTVTSAEV